MRIDNFVRLLLMFDLPMITNNDKRIYRKFMKYLSNEGFIMIQYSVYAKLCINSSIASTTAKHIKNNAPSEGDIRYLIISENQYQNIVNVNETYSLQEKITTSDRTLIIGGMNK